MTPYRIRTHRTVKQTVVALALVPVYIAVVACLAIRELKIRTLKHFIGKKACATPNSTFYSNTPPE